MSNVTITVRESDGTTETDVEVLGFGRQAASASKSLTLATEDKAVLDLVATSAKQDAEATLIGAVNETAPASDTASSGLNGRLQRIAQRLTSLIALLPASLGAGGGLKVDGSGTALPVSLASVPSHAVTNAGTFAVQAAGDVAHDAADSGSPVKVGYKATTSLSGVTLVSSGDRTDSFAGVDGVPIVRMHCNLEDIVSGTASNTDGTSTQVIAAAGSGIKQYLTRVSLSNTHASTSVMVALKSGSTSKYRVNVPPGGREFDFNPPLPPNASNEAWNFDPDSAVTTIECSMVGFKSKV